MRFAFSARLISSRLGHDVIGERTNLERLSQPFIDISASSGGDSLKISAEKPSRSAGLYAMEIFLQLVRMRSRSAPQVGHVFASASHKYRFGNQDRRLWIHGAEPWRMNASAWGSSSPHPSRPLTTHFLRDGNASHLEAHPACVPRSRSLQPEHKTCMCWKMP